MIVTYAGDRLGHALEDGNVPRVDLGCSHLLVVGVEPQVVGTIASKVVLVTSQIQVPHVVFLY